MSSARRNKAFRGNHTTEHPSPNARPVGEGLAEVKEREAAKRERRREALRAEVHRDLLDDAHYTARRAVADDPVLSERFARYEACGGPVVDLSGVPAYRTHARIEAALEAFDAGRSAQPCDACGSFAHRWPGPYGETITDINAKPPAHSSVSVVLDDVKRDMLLCGRCLDEHTHRTDGIEQYAALVFAALAGYKSSPGLRARLAFEVADNSGSGDGTPWSHLDRGAVLALARHELTSGDWMRTRLVTSPEQAATLARAYGLHPSEVYVWEPRSIPRRKPSPEVYLRRDMFGSVEGFSPTPESKPNLHAQAAEDSRARHERIAAAEADNAKRVEAFKAKHLNSQGFLPPEHADAYDTLLRENKERLRNAGARFLRQEGEMVRLQ
ncbi:hypothetical protein ACIRN4_23875 [Pimelobacter simplex]|uniref:hypothetical protein n=1 Tax=Nocardioides simplex TaxID=2045 RepID=UPI00380AE9BD